MSSPGMSGAYGFRFSSVDLALDGLLDVPPDWPLIRLRQASASCPPNQAVELDVREHDATLRLPGASLLLDRRQAVATIAAPAPLGPDRLLHPVLGYIASAFAHWLGRLAFHGGAFSANGGAIALLGDRGAGKSSTLGWLAGAGEPPLSDDVVVLRGQTAFAGPRSVDLWPDAAQALGVAAADSVRGGARQRLAPPAVPAELPLRAWVALAWGTHTHLRPLRVHERYPMLVQHLHVHRDGELPGREALLDLLALPAFELVRPRSLDSLAESGGVLLELGERVTQERSPADPKTGALGRSG